MRKSTPARRGSRVYYMEGKRIRGYGMMMVWGLLLLFSSLLDQRSCVGGFRYHRICCSPLSNLFLVHHCRALHCWVSIAL